MTVWQLLFTVWDFYPSVIIGSVALVAAYLWAVYWKPGWRMALFLAGVGLMVWALVGALDVLGDDYLFSAHMAQHLILIEASPPLVLLGTPRQAFDRLLKSRFVSRAADILGNPWVAWISAVVVLYAWHIPLLYNAALANENIHVVEHLFFLVTATMFWWPILTPVTERRLDSSMAFLYLMGAGIANTFLGILIAYVPPQIYPAYQNPVDELGILSMIRDQWGLTRANDQVLGGLLMWIPGGIVYAGAILGILARWYAEPDGPDPALSAVDKSA